jgi:hypothetical protein
VVFAVFGDDRLVAARRQAASFKVPLTSWLELLRLVEVIMVFGPVYGCLVRRPPVAMAGDTRSPRGLHRRGLGTGEDDPDSCDTLRPPTPPWSFSERRRPVCDHAATWQFRKRRSPDVALRTGAASRTSLFYLPRGATQTRTDHDAGVLLFTATARDLPPVTTVFSAAVICHPLRTSFQPAPEIVSSWAVLPPWTWASPP